MFSPVINVVTNGCFHIDKLEECPICKMSLKEIHVADSASMGLNGLTKSKYKNQWHIAEHFVDEIGVHIIGGGNKPYGCALVGSL